MKRARDYQQKRTYDFHFKELVPRFDRAWKEGWRGTQKDFDECCNIILWALTRFQPPVVLNDKGEFIVEWAQNGKRCYGGRTRIILSPPGCRPLVALHEASHAIEEAFFADALLPAHGPEFMAIHLDLVAEWFDVSYRRLVVRAKDMGIDVSSRERVGCR